MIDKKLLSQFFVRYQWFGIRKLYLVSKRTIDIFFNICVDSNLFQKSLNQSLIKRKISKDIIEIFEGDVSGHNLNLSQYFLGFGLIHYSFIRNIKPKKILCVGSRKGFIPVILALAAKLFTNRLDVGGDFPFMQIQRYLNQLRKITENGAAFGVFGVAGAMLTGVDAPVTNMPADGVFIGRLVL